MVRGLKTGQATITVKIKEKDYVSVTASVLLHVVEQFTIYPESPLYVLPRSVIQYSLATLTSNAKRRLNLVTLPSPNYKWINSNEALGKLGQNGLLSCHSTPGKIPFTVTDIQTVDNNLHGTVYVVPPAIIDIYIKEFTEDSWENRNIENMFNKRSFEEEKFENVWNLIKDRKYYIRVYLYDENRNSIFITNNAKIKFSISNEYVEILEQRNHELLIRPKKSHQRSIFNFFSR